MSQTINYEKVNSILLVIGFVSFGLYKFYEYKINAVWGEHFPNKELAVALCQSSAVEKIWILPTGIRLHCIDKDQFIYFKR